MVNDKEKMLQTIADCVSEIKHLEIRKALADYLREGCDARDALKDGLVVGLLEGAQRQATGEYAIPELLDCSEVFYEGLRIISPYYVHDESEEKGGVVLAVVRGDTHDLGKNLLKALLEASGYKVIDLGVDVFVGDIIDAVEKNDVSVLCLSTLMTSSLEDVEEIVGALYADKLRSKVKIILGGVSLSDEYLAGLGIDGYSESVIDSVNLIEKMMGYAE